MTGSSSHIPYRPEIDGLRAVAVLAVVIHHAVPTLLPGGFVGVDVFFVISGYLITSLLVQEWQTQGRISLADFYARRVKRLLPALLVMIIATLLLSVLLLAPIGGQVFRVTNSALASLVFLANLYFLQNTGGYFDGASDEQPFLHLWSLAVEEQFYLLYPLLLLALLPRGRKSVILALAVISVLSLLLAEHWLQVAPKQAFFQMPARFWELALGGLLALSRPAMPGRRAAGAIVGLGLALIAGSCAMTMPGAHFPGIGALPAVLGAALVLFAVHAVPEPGSAGALLRSRPFVFMGVISYPLYLWHWPLLALDRAVTLGDSPPGWRLSLCLLAIGLAWLSYRFVEQPIRGMRGVRPRKVLLTGAVATLVVAGAAMLADRTHMQPEEIRELVERTRSDHPPRIAECHFGLAAKVDALKPASCHSRPESPTRVAIWGDSHALAWQPLAFHLAETRGLSMASLTMDACPPVRNFTGFRSDFPGHGGNCARFNRLALDELQSGRFDTVIIAARWTNWLPAEGDANGSPRPGDRWMDRRELELELEAGLDALAGVPEVILMGPLPELRENAALCIGAGREHKCSVRREDAEANTARAREVLGRIARSRANVSLVDPIDFFCDDRECPVMKDGYALYWDDDHVSSTAARAFASRYLEDPSRYTSAAKPPRVQP